MRKTCSDRETHPIYAGLNKPLSQLMTQFEINQQCLNSNLSELKQSKNSSQMQCKALQKRFQTIELLCFRHWAELGLFTFQF